MEVLLPSVLNRNYMYDLIYQSIDENLLPRSSDIKFNFRPLFFIEPVGVTVLCNLTEWLLKRGVKLTYGYPQNAMTFQALSYLDDSQFFKRYLSKTLSPFSSVRPTTVPLELVSYKDSYKWLEKTLFWLSRRLNVTQRSLANLKVCFEEIFNNINDHSQENTGCVFMQHYPNKNEIKVAISDFGVGIPYNIQKQFPFLTDSKAILKATEQGYSTKSTPKNRGAGLDTLIYNVVKNNKGRVYIHSNGGILICKCIDNEITHELENSSGFYPGTLIEVVFKTDTIENILDSEEEFEW